MIAEAISMIIKSEENIDKAKELIKGLTEKYPLI